MSGKFEPKGGAKQLDPPKDTPISLAELAAANGTTPPSPPSIFDTRSNSFIGSAGSTKTYVAIKGKVYEVTGNKAYQEGGSYHGITLSPPY